WWLFPQRINALGLKTRATTLSDLLVADLPKKQNRILRRLIGLVIVLCLAGYVSAPWIAGEKFLAGAFDFSGFVALAPFAVVITVYTAIGGFRGSVYVDSFQAVFRIFGTILAVGAVALYAHFMGPSFWENLSQAGPDFLALLPGKSVVAAVGLIL